MAIDKTICLDDGGIIGQIAMFFGIEKALEFIQAEAANGLARIDQLQMRGDGVDLKSVVGVLAVCIDKKGIIIVGNDRIGGSERALDFISQLADDLQ